MKITSLLSPNPSKVLGPRSQCGGAACSSVDHYHANRIHTSHLLLAFSWTLHLSVLQPISHISNHHTALEVSPPQGKTIPSWLEEPWCIVWSIVIQETAAACRYNHNQPASWVEIWNTAQATARLPGSVIIIYLQNWKAFNWKPVNLL